MTALSLNPGERLLNLDRFGLYDLQEDAMNQVLARAPMEFSPGYESEAVIVTIPDPQLNFARFRVVESPIMEPGLAELFPDIKTWRGIGIDDPYASVRFDMTMHGFHAQVLSPEGNYYIDPLFKGQTGYYSSYYKQNLKPSGDFYEEEIPGADSDHSHFEFVSPNPGTGSSFADSGPAPSFGTQLRTMRLANAATGEYTAFHGGTVAAGQAAIVTAINRVTGLYEVDLAIRMVLVANNSTLVYTNGATDPYSNNSGSTMLGQNQANIDAVIGDANYDIGHVFSTGGGGIAGLGVVGRTGFKARGVTGLPSPTGDPFYIDYVAHEMGHQYGANHSFNSQVCSGNRNASTAYEPGSGSTIMSYAGICGADDLQPNSDVMFHSISIDEIRAYITTGFGSGTGTTTNTGNSVPTVNAGADYVIPTGTPFELTATGSDPNPGNALTYSWEQRDLGAAQFLSAADNGTSPLFRTWNPTASPTRVFPRLSNLLNNTVPIGEKLPTVARASMDFRVVVRDNALNGGGVASDDMFIQVVNTGSAFSVTSQNSATTWGGGSTQTVTWNVAGTTAAPINTATVNILFSTDGGLTWPTVLASATANDGTQAITIPNISTTQGRIKIKATNSVYFDINNVNITVNPLPVVGIAGPAGQIVEGHTGTSIANFVLTLSSAPTAPVSINYASTSAGFANPATAGSDYTPVSGTANFGIGQTSFNIPVTIFGDRFTEGIEQFKIDLSGPSSGLLVGTSSATGSISDDDAFALGKTIDFGSLTSPVQAGATGFSTGAYTSAIGIGWTSSSDMITYSLTFGDDLTSDLILATTGMFRIDLPNGNYNVTAIFGVVDYQANRANYPTAYGNFTVSVEGVNFPVVLESGPNVTRTFAASVTDGKLDIGLDSVIARQRARFSGLLVTASSFADGSGGENFRDSFGSSQTADEDAVKASLKDLAIEGNFMQLPVVAVNKKITNDMQLVCLEEFNGLTNGIGDGKINPAALWSTWATQSRQIAAVANLPSLHDKQFDRAFLGYQNGNDGDWESEALSPIARDLTTFRTFDRWVWYRKNA